MTTTSPSIVFTSTSNSSNSSDSGQHSSNYDLALRITFAFISVTSVVPNILFLMAMLLNYGGTRRAYHNILLYNLMITDAFAGVAIVVTPNLIMPEDLIKYPGGFLGELFCRLLVSQFIVFMFGVVSVYTVVFLSVERWLAVKYPFKYRTSISSTKLKTCIVVIWLLALLVNTPHLREMRSFYELDAVNSCKWRSAWKSQTRHILAILEISVKFVFPSAVLLLVLFSLYREFHGLKAADMSQRPGQRRQHGREHQLLRMCTATSITVLLCWSPNQVLYMLYKFDKAHIGTVLHNFTVVLAISTSSVNPLIYFVTSKTYRTCLLSFLYKMFGKCVKTPVRQTSRNIPLGTPHLVNRANKHNG